MELNTQWTMDNEEIEEINFIVFKKTKDNLKDLIPFNGKAIFIGCIFKYNQT